ncbi:MAG: hypothetical protein AAFZ91_04920 [Pseudomonadota bacterium]
MLVPAYASWLDSDFYCRNYGCVVVHDGVSFDVYDNYVFATGGNVPVGGRMIPWTGNPFQGTGEVNPVITGSITEGLTTAPLEEQSIMLGIDTNGDGTPDLMPGDLNNSGFLDAGDTMDPFNLTVATDLVAANTSAQRSFYVSSTTDFYLTGQAIATGSGFGTVADLSGISLTYDVNRSGTDAGMSYGSNTRNGNYIREIANVSSLADLSSGPVRLLEFRNSIRLRDATLLPTQSVRFDYVYDFGNYDLSMGRGDLQYEIEFDFYNR